jgi:hypothetical protein
MHAKFLHTGRAERPLETRRTRAHGDLTWVMQVLLIVAMLALLAVAYGIFRILHAEPPFREVAPDTLLLVPAPVP